MSERSTSIRSRGSSRGRPTRGRPTRGQPTRGRTTRGRTTRGRIAHGGARTTRGRGSFRRPFDRHQIHDIEEDETNLQEVEADINVNPKVFFINSAVSLEQHIQAQSTNIQRYLATLFTLEKKKVVIKQKAKACILAAAWCRHDHALADGLLENKNLFSLPEVLKAANMLDAGRQIRTLEKHLKRIEATKTKTKSKKIGKIKNQIDNLTKMQAPIGSLTGAVARHIQRWTQSLTQSELEYFALHMPIEPWKKLADLVHFNPSRDFPALPWFLSYCFGEAAPSDTMVARCQSLNSGNVNELLIELPIPYSHLKEYRFHLTNESKARIADREEKLDTIIWNYEDLQCPEVDEIVSSRLREGEKISLPYGKLMERLILLRTLQENNTDGTLKKTSMYQNLIDAADSQLKNIKLTLESPVAILGDASSSMDVAIQTSTILSSLLTTVCSAELSFFNHESFPPEFVPKNIEEVLNLALGTEALGRTSNAAGLLPYFQEKKIVKTFVMVTDEEENTPVELDDGSKHMFFSLFMKYREEVYPAKLVFISFLKNQHDLGQIYQSFMDFNIKNVIQFKFNGDRPDLTKIDNMLGILSIGFTN